MSNINLYVFQLTHGCFYIGCSEDVNRSFVELRAGFGPEWTRTHKPISIIQVVENAEEYHETAILYEYFKVHGLDKVRGGPYRTSILSPTQQKNIRDKLAEIDEASLYQQLSNMSI